MGEVIDFTRRQIARAERRKTERSIAILAIASAALIGYFTGHSRGEDQVRNNQILMVNKACVQPNHLQGGNHLNLQLSGNENGLKLTVNGVQQLNEDLGTALSHHEPNELIC